MSSSSLASKVDQLIWECYLKAADVILQGRRAVVTPILTSPSRVGAASYPSIVTLDINDFADNSDYCSKIMREWRKNITAPLILDLFISEPNSENRHLLERWVFIYQRKEKDEIKESRISLVNRKIVTFIRSLICFIRLLPGYQYLNISQKLTSISFQVYNPDIIQPSNFMDESSFYEFPKLQSSKGLLSISVRYMKSFLLQQFLGISFGISWKGTKPIKSDPYAPSSSSNSVAIPIPGSAGAGIPRQQQQQQVGSLNSNSSNTRRPSGSYDPNAYANANASALTQYPSFTHTHSVGTGAGTGGIASSKSLSSASSKQYTLPRSGSNGKFSVGKPPSHPGDRDYNSYSPASYSPSSFTPVFSIIDNSLSSPSLLGQALITQHQQYQQYHTGASNQIAYYLPGLSGFLIDEGLFGISPPFPQSSAHLLSTSPQVHNASTMQHMITSLRRTLSDRNSAQKTVPVIDIESSLPTLLPRSPFDNAYNPEQNEGLESPYERRISDDRSDKKPININIFSTDRSRISASSNGSASSSSSDDDDDDMPFAWAQSDSLHVNTLIHPTTMTAPSTRTRSIAEQCVAPPTLQSFPEYRYNNVNNEYFMGNVNNLNNNNSVELLGVDIQMLKDFRAGFS